MYIIVFILILALLVLVHEFGHFIAAKKTGVKVEEFGFGFPPRLFGIKKGETLYSINMLPIGGFVKLYGEEYQEMKKTKSKKTKSKAFVYKHPFQKALIIVAGVIGNFLLAWVLISFLFTQGVPVPINKVLVDKVIPGSPAAQSGIQEKDYIDNVSVGNKHFSIAASQDLIDLSKKYAGQELVITIERSGAKKTVLLTPRIKPPQGQGPLGIVITSFAEKKYPWYKAPFYGLIESLNITQKIATELLKTVFQLIMLKKPQVDVAGPVGIAQYTNQAIKFGQNAVLELIALLSLNLAIINILPFPALDGGRLVFVVYEWITKRRVNQKIEQYTNLVGIFILLSLAVLITLHDIMRLLK